jgi:PAS domain S-box-containing protein
VFRLFATEIDLKAEGAPLPEAVRAQLPYMQVAATEFSRKHGMVGTYLVGRDGRVYLASAAAPILKPDQREAARRVFDSAALAVLPVRPGEDGLVLDVVFPLTPVQTIDPSQAKRPVGALLIAVPVTADLARMLAPSSLDPPGERTRLVQSTATGAVEVKPETSDPLVALAAASPGQAGAPLPFGERRAVGSRAMVLSAGVPVPNTSWLVVQEADRDRALEPLVGYTGTGVSLAFLLTLLVGAAFVAVWLRQRSEANHALAIQYHSLASRMQAQRRLLDSVNNAIEDWIGFKNLEGEYVYVNPAFARAVGRSVSGVVGNKDASLFGGPVAERLRVDDQRVLAGGDIVTNDVEVDIMGRRRHLTMSKAPLRSEDEVMVGIVSVARDITEAVEHRRMMDAAARATTSALVHAVEMHDPYLAGHSQRMGELCTAVGRRLGLGGTDLVALEMAAMLSQIGKLSVPRDLLAKESRLTPEEIAVVQGHIGHAEETLGDIDFGMPVKETVLQMHERLDGTGYPHGLKDDEITMLGCIIGACDVYCARIAPRAYRATIPPERIIKILTDHPEKYDARVVAALSDQVTTEQNRTP